MASVVVVSASASVTYAGLKNFINDISQDTYSSNKGAGKATRMTAKEATQAAESLGFQKTNSTSHGQPVFKKGNTYIDVDGHTGGVEKQQVLSKTWEANQPDGVRMMLI